MTFDSLLNFLPKAFENINQKDLANAGMTCTRVNAFIKKNYPQMNWHASKFVDGELTINVKNATDASLLFLENAKLRKRLHKLDLSESVTGISVKVA